MINIRLPPEDLKKYFYFIKVLNSCENFKHIQFLMRYLIYIKRNHFYSEEYKNAALELIEEKIDKLSENLKQKL